MRIENPGSSGLRTVWHALPAPSPSSCREDTRSAPFLSAVSSRLSGPVFSPPVGSCTTSRTAPPPAKRSKAAGDPMSYKVLSTAKCFGGTLSRVQHASAVTKTDMIFAVFMPETAEGVKVPALYYLSGLTCTDENFMGKAGAQRAAAAHGIALIAPDTSPRAPTPGPTSLPLASSSLTRAVCCQAATRAMISPKALGTTTLAGTSAAVRYGLQ